MKRLGMMLLFFCFSVEAKTTYELYADCDNYCSFREFTNNCHGIAFRSERKGEIDYLYTRYSKVLDSCFYTRPPFYQSIPIREVKQACDCSHLPMPQPLPPENEPMKDQTRQDLIALRQQIRDWAPCATDPSQILPVTEDGRFSPSDQGVCKQMKNGYMVLGGCEPGMSSHYCVFYGNTNNVAGPFCLAGDLDRCKDIALSQDPLTGGWFRNAFQKRDPLSERGQPLFSRDELLGVLMYLVKTRDQEAAKKWMQFVERNPKKLLTGSKRIKVYNICPSHGVESRPPQISEEQWKGMQPDDRCEMRPHDWGAMYAVYKHIGFSDQELISISKEMYSKMIALKPIISATAYLSALTVPARNYQLALQATMILLYRSIGYFDHPVLNAAAELINERTAKDSPYYHYLAMGNRATEYGASLIKKYCSSEKPNYLNPPQGGVGIPAASFFDSGNHTFGGRNRGSEAKMPIGHDCIGWINLYLNAPVRG